MNYDDEAIKLAEIGIKLSEKLNLDEFFGKFQIKKGLAEVHKNEFRKREEK